VTFGWSCHPGGKRRGLRRGQHQLATVARTTGDPAMKVWPATMGSASRASAAVARRFESLSALQLRHLDISQARLEHSLKMAKI
jgi:hypothetical protein